MADGTEGGISGGEYGGYNSDAFGGGYFGTPGLGDGSPPSESTGGNNEMSAMFDPTDPMDAASIEALATNPAYNGNWNETNPTVETDFMDALLGFYSKHKSAINTFGKLALGLASKSNPIAAGVNGLMSMYNAAQNPQATAGNMAAGNFASGALGFGPVSSAVTGMLGGAALGSMSPTGQAPAGNTNAGKDMDYYDLGAGLGNIYLQGRNARETRGLADNLASLYSQDSPYAQMLRQQLLRSDARSGKRSQAGIREVELQARLADLNSRNAPEIARLRDNATLKRMQQLNQLWALNRTGGKELFKDLYDKTYSGLGSLYDYAAGAANNMFNSPIEVSTYNPATDYTYGYGGE